jgi:hypothetical protein
VDRLAYPDEKKLIARSKELLQWENYSQFSYFY